MDEWPWIKYGTSLDHESVCVYIAQWFGETFGKHALGDASNLPGLISEEKILDGRHVKCRCDTGVQHASLDLSCFGVFPHEFRFSSKQSAPTWRW